MRLLYVSSGGSPIDTAATGQLAKTVGRTHLTEVESAAAAIAELRETATEYHALLISPGFNETEVLALIRGLRNEGAPVAIVPVVSEAQRGLCTSAVRAGAEAVLMMMNGVLVDTQETLNRILPRASAQPPPVESAPSRPPAAVVATQRALAELRKLHWLLYGKARKSDAAGDEADHEPGDGGRLGLTQPVTKSDESVSPAGAEDAMADKSRSTHAPAHVGTPHTRRPVLASVPTVRDSRGAEKTFDSRTRAALEAALQASRVELRRAADAHAAERDVWEATRKELEARLDDGRPDVRGRMELEGALVDAQKRLAMATDGFAAERAAWENTRRELEMRVKTLQAVIGSTRKIEAELRTTQAELQRVTSGEGSKESGWEEARQRLEAELESRTSELESRANELETRTHALDVANAERTRLQESLEAAHAELQRMATSHAEAAFDWERHREQLEHQLIELQAAGESARNEWASAHHATSDAEQARSEAEGLRTELETRTRALEELRAEHARLAAAYRGLEGKLSEAREQVRQLGNRPSADPVQAPAASAGLADLRRDGNRAEQIGKLGAAMAPEIEALVSSIDQSASKLVRQFDPSNPQRAEIEAILKSSSRATSLVRQLLTFSRRQARPVARVEVNDVVKRAEPSLARLLGADIELKLALGPAGALTAGDHDVEQMLSVLMFSVRESLPLGGSVVISTATLDGSRLQIAATAFGYGVQPARSSSALDGVVRRCGGELTLAGEPDRDAVVQISLPQAQPARPAE
jgi:signal transduction histidine kinase